MPQYLIVHNVVNYPESQDDWISMWRALRRSACGDAKWLHSFYEPATQKMYCQWDAPDVQTIMDCMPNEIISVAPVESSSEVVLFDVSWLDETG